jgi:hypothetical protein
MKGKISIIIGIILALLALIKSLNDDYFFQRGTCYEKNKMNNLVIYSQIVRKYNDIDHHNYNTLLLKDLKKGDVTKLYIVVEEGGYYQKVMLGDTLKKVSGSLIILDLTQKRVDTLKYNCDK